MKKKMAKGKEKEQMHKMTPMQRQLKPIMWTTIKKTKERERRRQLPKIAQVPSSLTVRQKKNLNI